jgi:hypothetical protein
MKSLKPKFILSLLFVVLISTCFTSCVVHRSPRVVVVKQKRLPPGQAKKIYGGSAKDYAPGQQKKNK